MNIIQFFNKAKSPLDANHKDPKSRDAIASENNYVSVSGTAGTFYSENFPTNYSNGYEEHYIITVEDGFRISLYFEHFDIEYHVSCLYDYIKGKTVILSF